MAWRYASTNNVISDTGCKECFVMSIHEKLGISDGHCVSTSGQQLIEQIHQLNEQSKQII